MKTYGSTIQAFQKKMTSEGCVRVMTNAGDADALGEALASRNQRQPFADTEALETASAWCRQNFKNESIWVQVYTADGWLILGVSRDVGGARASACTVSTFFADLRARQAGAFNGLRRLGDLAAASDPGFKVELPNQSNLMFLWGAPSVHPLQIGETHFQHKAAQATATASDVAQARQAVANVLEEGFFMTCDLARGFGDLTSVDAKQGSLASVRVNALIDSFHLYRLLVGYRIITPAQPTDAQRDALSGALTATLHSRDPKMVWLGTWLTKTIGNLAIQVEALNPADGQKEVLFFLKGGRAMNYWLGTPEQGENDWDTQVVINPHLSEERWYEIFAKVHNLLVDALTLAQKEFSEEIVRHSEAFSEFIEATATLDQGPTPSAHRIRSPIPATCKAELIDVGIPRRDQPAAREEWQRITAKGGLQTSANVPFPANDYYFNEYLTMIREAFQSGGNVAKAPKRIVRFQRILTKLITEPEEPRTTALAACLPDTIKKIGESYGSPEFQIERLLLTRMAALFVEAYHLRFDAHAAHTLDTAFAGLVAASGQATLPPEFSELDDAQRRIAHLVKCGHQAASAMTTNVADRSAMMLGKVPAFLSRLQSVYTALTPTLSELGAQMVVSGAMASHLHARRLGSTPEGIEPLWRIVVKIQFTGNLEDAWKAALAGVKTVTGEGDLELHVETDPEHHVVNAFLGKGGPQVMKLRLTKHDILPPIEMIDRVPVTPLRYLVADYAARAAKIDEPTAKRTLMRARDAAVLMATRLTLQSDEAST